MLYWTVNLDGAPRHFDPAAVVVEHKVYCFGGYWDHSSRLMEVHVFNTVSLRWMKLPLTNDRGEQPVEVPDRHHGHKAVLIDHTVYISGGNPVSNLLYAFDVDAHKWYEPKMSGTVPEARYGHSVCALGKVMYIHGGNIPPTGQTHDIYKLDTTIMVWSLINTRGTTPPCSALHSATIIGTKMFVFGGCGDNTRLTRVFDTETDCWLNTPSALLLPEQRLCHSAFTYNGELYIFGGYNIVLPYAYNQFNDLWKFNPETFSWKKVEPKGKGPSQIHKMCCCMVAERIIFFGGNTSLSTFPVCVTDDLYILDLSPTLKSLCKLAVIQYGVEQSELPHDIIWELTAMTKNSHEQ